MGSSVRQKRVLLGVCGGIAAYKSAQLARDLGRKGFEVRVILTQAALAFIQPLTFQALTGHSVHTDLLDPEAEAGMGHIELAKWADLLLIAPATANSIAQMAAGLAPDLLSNVYLATKAPVAIAPAMNQAMWQHAATRANIALLTQRGHSILGPAAGEQACGDVGAGRMMEPENLADAVASLLEQQQGQVLPGKLLKGKRLLINAGPTREALDPVRYISNHSSGKMGFALARAAVAMGAEVSLVHGPVNLSPPQGVTAIAVQSAEQMLEACLDQAGRSDLFIAAAAVADFRAQSIAEQKLKKGDEDKILIEFIKNPDILQTVAALKQGPLCVGFAAETENVEIYARKKLETKKLDAIIANDVSDKSIGFNSEDNAVVIITAEDKVSFAKAPKTQLAEQILHWLAKELLACKVPASN